jgi:hypothetical protein
VDGKRTFEFPSNIGVSLLYEVSEGVITLRRRFGLCFCAGQDNLVTFFLDMRTQQKERRRK